jgi:transposase
MAYLEDVSVEELQSSLNDTDDKTPAQRLIAAIAYKDGIDQTTLSEWFNVERKTIYNWLTRLEENATTDGAKDSQRSGRNRKLSDVQLEEFRETVNHPPAEAEIAAPAWTPRLVQTLLADRYEVEYSIQSCRRLLKEAGLSYQKPRPEPAEADDDEREEFYDEIKKSAGGWTPN